jgi:hypothetical protein
VGEILEDLEALLDDGMALPALDMGNETDAAGVVFLIRPIEALGLWDPRAIHVCKPLSSQLSRRPLPRGTRIVAQNQAKRAK